MRANELLKPLTAFIKKEDPYKSILIDGAWGIGKTFEVKRATERRKKVIYISLFGIKDMEALYRDLVALLYEVIEEGMLAKQFVEKARNAVQWMSEQEVLPHDLNKYAAIFAPKVNLSSLLKKLNSVEQKFIIIFDDLERHSEDFSIQEFMGLVEALRLQETRVILIANSKELPLESKNYFDRYAEKIVDKTFVIDELSDELKFNKVDYNSAFVQVFIDRHHIVNIRTLEKAQMFFEDVCAQLSPIRISESVDETIREICYAIVVEDIEKIYEKELYAKLEECKKKTSHNAEEFEQVTFQLALDDFEYRIATYYLYGHTAYFHELLTAIIEYYKRHKSLNCEYLEVKYAEYLTNNEQAVWYRSTDEVKAYVVEAEQKLADDFTTVTKFLLKADSILTWKEVLGEECGELLGQIESHINSIIETVSCEELGEQAIVEYRMDLNYQPLRDLADKVSRSMHRRELLLLLNKVVELGNTQDFVQALKYLERIEYAVYEDKEFLATHFEMLLNEVFLLTGNVPETKVRCWRKIVKICTAVDKERYGHFINEMKIRYADDAMFQYRMKTITL